MTPNLTLNYGLRWDLQTPFRASNDTLDGRHAAVGLRHVGPWRWQRVQQVRLLQPRRNTGVVPRVRCSSPRATNGYETDWNNVAPSISVAWQPNVQGGFLRTLLGDPDQATLRGGYSESFERQGLAAFTGLYGGNPGSTLSTNRTSGNGNLVLPGRVVADAPQPARTAVSRFVPEHANVSRASAAAGRTASTPSRPTSSSVGAHLVAQLPALDLAATWRWTSATSARAASISGPS